MSFLVSNNQDRISVYHPHLAAAGGVSVVSSFQAMLQHVEACGAALAVIDAEVPGFAGDSALKQLKQLNPALKVLLVGVFVPEEELAMLAAGAMGCCSPDMGGEQVRRVLSIVEEGGVWISSAALPQLLQRLRARTQQPAPPAAAAAPVSHLSELTGREREISRMVAAGDSNKVIARKLNITDRTVKAHLTMVFQKLQVHDRLQLALLINKLEA